jgi:two-component system response regulator (stage 0 sporulation protein A)
MSNGLYPAGGIGLDGARAKTGYDGRFRRVVVAMADKQAAEDLRTSIHRDDMDVVGLTTNGLDAVQLVVETAPDAVLADLVMPGIDGCELVERIASSRARAMPVVMLFAVKGLEDQKRRALQAGVYKVFQKPVDLAEVNVALRQTGFAQRLNRPGYTRMDVMDFLWSLGLPAKPIGTEYLTTAVLLSLKDGHLPRQLTTKLYPLVASVHETNAKTIERCMRRAIESAWNAGFMERQHLLFGNTIDARRGKPTCGEFIARVSDVLRSKE